MPATIQGASVLIFAPSTTSDAVSTNEPGADNPAGCCQLITNLIPDRATPKFYAPRPASIAGINFTTGGFNTPGVVSVALQLGTYIYGMIGTARNVGYDEPFCYNTATSSFITVSGVTSSNVPPTPATSGDWTPPSMNLVGGVIPVCYPNQVSPNFFFWFNISTISAPTWHAGNLTGALPFIGTGPTAVTSFNGRAYYATGNTAIFSDAGNALNTTSATQALTIGDNTGITGFGQQPLGSATQGGIVQAILVFKQLSITQITGDPTTNNLTVNTLTSSVGCNAPRTIATTPAGVMFMANDGIRYIQLTGYVSDPIPALKLPFINVYTPTRSCAAYNNGVYRISVISPNAQNTNTQAEYFFDFKYGWTGPHTFPANIIVPFSTGFMMANNSISGLMFTTAVSPSPTDTYVENGNQLTWQVLSAPIRNAAPMQQMELIESTCKYITGGVGESITISALYSPGGSSSQQNELATLTFQVGGTIWGAFNWGAADWSQIEGGLSTYTVPWPDVISFQDLQWQVTGTSVLGQRFNNITSRVRGPGYTNQDNP